MTHTITITLTKKAQKTAALAGLPAQAEQTYEVPLALLPRLVALGADVDADGDMSLRSSSVIRGAWDKVVGSSRFLRNVERSRPDGLLDLRPDDAEAAIAVTEIAVSEAREAGKASLRQLRKEEEEEKAEKERKRQERIERIRGLPVGSLIRRSYRRWDVRNESGCYRADIEAAGRLDEAEAEAGRRNEELDARAAAQDAERLRWIAEHGSTRLKRLVAESIEHQAVYRDERLALERPGWRWDVKVPGEGDDPRNAPEEAISLLDEARTLDPEARLTYWTVPACENEHWEDDDECPGYHEGWRGYACTAVFLGRKIVFGGPEND